MQVASQEAVVERLSDLEDVIITDDLKDGQLLQYDEEYKVWGNVTLESAEETRF